jgi:hypothetical protein
MLSETKKVLMLANLEGINVDLSKAELEKIELTIKKITETLTKECPDGIR